MVFCKILQLSHISSEGCTPGNIWGCLDSLLFDSGRAEQGRILVSVVNSSFFCKVSPSKVTRTFDGAVVLRWFCKFLRITFDLQILEGPVISARVWISRCAIHGDRLGGNIHTNLLRSKPARPPEMSWRLNYLWRGSFRGSALRVASAVMLASAWSFSTLMSTFFQCPV